jgi:phenylacetate-CoA ligase
MAQITGFDFNFEGQNRVAFNQGAVNPRDQLGKIGIRVHTRFESIFRDTVPLLLEPRAVYLNRKSAVQWINAQIDPKEQLALNASNSDVLKKLHEVCGKEPVTRKSNAPQHPLSRTIDRIKGTFWNTLWNLSTSSWSLFKARFLLLNQESSLQNGSQSRANAIFWKAKDTVPAYQALLKNSSPTTFEQIPITDKSSYIKPYNDSKDTHLTLINGKLPHHGQCNTSTGTTGKPTMWIRGPEEQEMTKKLIHLSTRTVVGDQPLFLINAFALGPWATGLTTSSVFFDRAVTFSPGPDMDKIFDILEQFPPDKYPDRKYVIAGYPPFIKNLVELAKERKFDLSPYQLTAIVGGEGISDATRDHIQQNGFDRVISSYGASDLDVPIGQETPFTDALRKVCQQHPAFMKELFGSEQMPMVFQYDPLNYYIESNEHQQLIYTCVRQDRSSPRIRYNLKDLGKIIRMSDVLAIAQKHQIHLSSSLTNLPLLCVWCREGAVTYGSMKIPIEDLERAIEKIPQIAGKIQNYAFRSREINHQQHVSFLLEFKENEKCSLSNVALHRKIIEELKSINEDFRAATAAFQNQNLPLLELFAFGQSPMSSQGVHQKKQHIFH